MPEDVGGTPSADGREPDDDRDRGGADEEFASVVFDEDFVRSAEFHEPSAVERLLAAAEARAEAEHRRARARRRDDRTSGSARDPQGSDPYGAACPHDRYDREAYGDDGTGDTCPACVAELMEDRAGRRPRGRWHRPVAWLLAIVMGIGMVALAFTAVYRGSSPDRQDPVPPPATTGVDRGASASTDHSEPPVPAQTRTP
ncbi:SCO2584 family spore wall biosynthesis protein [Streptomyces boluensis]|uniref:Uncharacterized protein n=1 Tax=Streptomyces boluensis TaxID=1775135 RepID=A0A964XKG7_9ACTN|nr:hypothetical protein [Streptomyces boluensis]